MIVEFSLAEHGQKKLEAMKKMNMAFRPEKAVNVTQNPNALPGQPINADELTDPDE